MTMADQAVKGLDVTAAGGIVCVKDGADTWLCCEAAWDAAIEQLSSREAFADDDGVAMAYDVLCDAVRGTIASLNGSSRGVVDEVDALVAAALAADLLDEDHGLVIEAARARARREQSV